MGTDVFLPAGTNGNFGALPITTTSSIQASTADPGLAIIGSIPGTVTYGGIWATIANGSQTVANYLAVGNGTDTRVNVPGGNGNTIGFFVGNAVAQQIKQISSGVFQTSFLAGNTTFAVSALTYGTTVSTDASLASVFTISVSNTTAFTISNPTNPIGGSVITYDIKNTSGGAMGTITWGAAFALAGAAFTNPATGKRRTITFYYNATDSLWIELSRASADI